MISPELQSKIAGWRAKAVEGTLTPEEMKEAIILLRAGRASSVVASAAAKRTKAKVTIPNAEDMIDELANL